MLRSKRSFFFHPPLNFLIYSMLYFSNCVIELRYYYCSSYSLGREGVFLPPLGQIPLSQNEKLGGGGIRMERKGTTSSWLGLSTQRLPKICPRSPQEPQTRSRPAWLAGLHGTTLSRMGAFLQFLLPYSIQTPTRQRLIVTRSPTKLDLLRYVGGGGPSYRLRTIL